MNWKKVVAIVLSLMIILPHFPVPISADVTTTSIADMSTARGKYVSSALLSNGNVIAIGGWDGTSILDTTEIYNVTNNTWSAGPTMNFPRSAIQVLWQYSVF